MPVADEARFENRMAPVFRLRRRRSGAHQPAGFRRAGLGLGIEAQEKGGDGFLRCGERQPPAGHQVENFRPARNLDHNSTQGGAGERIICRTQAVRRIGHAEQQQAFGINSKFQKPGCRKLAEFQGGKILANPEQAFTQGHAGGEAGHKTGGCRFMTNCSKNLMQHATLKPALQAKIGGSVTQRNADGGFLQPRPGEGGPEGRYFFHAHGFMKERNKNIVKRVLRDSFRNLIP